MLCRVAHVKCLPVRHDSADYIFWSFGIIEFIYDHFENRVLLKPMLECVAGVAHFRTCLYTRLNTTESTIFTYLVYSLLPKDLIIQILFTTVTAV